MCHSFKQLLIELPGNNYPIADISSSEWSTIKQEGYVPFLVPWLQNGQPLKDSISRLTLNNARTNNLIVNVSLDNNKEKREAVSCGLVSGV